MKSPLLLVGLLATIPLLSGCTATIDEITTCEGNDGIVVSRAFKMHAEEKTRSFTFCEVNGKITEVYNSNAEMELPKEADATCEGDLYTREDKKKNNEKNEVEVQHSFICVEDGLVAKSYFTSKTY